MNDDTEREVDDGAEVETEAEAPSVRESIDEARGIDADAPPIGEPAAEEAPAVETYEAPEHWSQLDKDRFNDLPSDIKPLWLEKSKSLETGYNEKFERVASYEKESQALDQIFAPLANELALHGSSRTDAIQRLVGAHQLLSSNPEEGLRWLAEQYGASHLLGSFDDDYGMEDFESPEVTQLKQQVAQLSGLMGQFQGSQQASQQAAAQYQIDAFAGAQDESGNPRYPYFQEVRQQMGQLFSIGAVSTLDEAYDKAVRMNDEVFTRVQSKTSQQAAQAADAKRKEEAGKARRAADARVVSSGKSGGDTKKHETLRGALKAAMGSG